VGFEIFIRFQPNPRDPRPYAPDAFLRALDTGPGSISCTPTTLSPRSDGQPTQAFEYRSLERGGQPAVVVTIEPDGFLVCEYDRDVGTQLLGPIVKYALDRAGDERVLIESA
jgi:hypothetical protein